MKMLKSVKGFGMGELSTVAITLVVASVTIAIGASILTSIQTNVAGSAYNASNTGTWNSAANASGYGLTGLNTLGSYIPTVALVAVAAVVIGIIFMFFARKQK